MNCLATKFDKYHASFRRTNQIVHRTNMQTYVKTLMYQMRYMYNYIG